MSGPHPLAWYQPGRVVSVSDKMQTGYSYVLAEPPGQNFAPEFTPFMSPAVMLASGVFEGKYLNDCRGELPEEWYASAKLSQVADPRLNEFKVKSRQSLQEWRAKGWIIGDDPRGWFQWYCRYWLGRRDPAVDVVQIKRHRAFVRHEAQVRKSADTAAMTIAQKRAHRPRQRQALLQWAYNPYV